MTGHCARGQGLFAELVVVAQFRLNQPPNPLQIRIKIGAMEQAVTQRQLLDEIHPQILVKCRHQRAVTWSPAC